MVSPTRVFFILLVLHLVPIWIITFFPTQDGPVHVHTASVLRYYFNPDFLAFQEYYTIRRSFDPNWIGHLLMGGLMYFFSPLVAEKLLLSFYVITLPLSIYYVLLAIDKNSVFLALLSFPFIFNYSLHMGFYNFCLSLPIFFLLLGYWLRYQDKLSTSKILTLSLLVLVLYFSHIVSFVSAAITLATIVFWRACVHGSETTYSFPKKLKTVWIISRQGLVSLVIMFLPATVLLAGYFFRNPGSSENASVMPSVSEVITRFIKIGGGTEVVSFSYYEIIVAVILHFFILSLIIYSLYCRYLQKRIHIWDGFFIGAVIFFGLYLFLPNEMAGGSVIQPRLALYIFLLLLLWLGTKTYSPWFRSRLQLAMVAIAISFLSLNTAKYWQLNSFFEEYASIEDKVVSNRTLLPLNFSPRGYSDDKQELSIRVEPFLHAQGYIAAMANLIDLGNYQATTDYFLIKFHPERNPYRIMPKFNRVGTSEEAQVDFSLYRQLSGGSVDYVLLSGTRDDHRTQKHIKTILDQLTHQYELIYVSSPRGFVQLYRRKTLSVEYSTSRSAQ
jgi:hypothetical protein